jgi:RNA polymerase sigma-70 factor (ECF subfamily)
VVENPFINLSDQKLMELYQNGDERAFSVIYERHKNKVFSYLHKRIQDPDLVDEVFQSCFVKFHKARHQYDSKYKLEQWLYTICRSELLDALKKPQLQTTELNEDFHSFEKESPSSPLDIESENSLNEKEKAALQLRYFSEESFFEISKKLETSESNARKIISRALAKLRTKYAGGLK